MSLCLKLGSNFLGTFFLQKELDILTLTISSVYFDLSLFHSFFNLSDAFPKPTS